MVSLDIFGNTEPLSIYVVRVDGEPLGCIDNIINESTASLSIGLNQQYVLELEAKKSNDSDWYDYLHEGMYLFVSKVGLFKMNQPTLSLDGQTETKTITAYSCDSELEDKTCSLQINMGLKTSMEYLVEYEEGETEVLVNPYTGIPYDWIVLYNTFPEQLTEFKDLLESGHFGTEYEGSIDVIDDGLIAELSDIFTLMPRLKNKVTQADEESESDDPVLTEYVITTYDVDEPNKVVMYELLSGLDDRIDELVTYYTKYRNQLSLLSMVLENTGGSWTIGDIYGLEDGDYSVCNKKYQFDISESVYSFLTNTLAKTINCLVTFDNTTRKVNVTPMENIGDNTGIVIGYDNLVNTLEIKTDEDRLTTRLKVSGGNDLDISRVNFGSNYVDDITYKINAVDSNSKRIYVSDALAQKYTTYMAYRETQREDYVQLSKDYADYTEKLSELNNRVPNDNLKNEWGTFTMEELQASLTTFNNLLISLEALYKEDYGTAGLNPDGTIDEDYIETTEYWYDYVAYKGIIEEIEFAIEVYPYYGNPDKWTAEQYEYYEEQVKSWETEWSLYGINELQAKIDTYKQFMDIMLSEQDAGEAEEAGHSAVILKPNGEDYEIKAWNDLTADEKALYGNSTLLYRYNDYDDVYQKWLGATAYMEVLQDEKAEIEEAIEEVQSAREEILGNVTLEEYFTAAECKILYRLFHDAEYSNENILSTSIDTASEKIDRMVELLEDAKDQASLVSRPQLMFSVDSDNIFGLPEFKPFWNKLQPGNYVLVQYKDNTYVKLRVIGYKFNPMLPTSDEFELTFSNFVRSRAYYRDWASIFGTSTSSISNSYGSSGGGSGGTFGESDDIDVTISNTMLAKLLNTESFGSRVASIIQDTIDAKVLTARLATFTNARINNLEGDHVSVTDLDAVNAAIETLDATKANISDLEAEYAHITNGVIDNATIDYADVNDLGVHYAEIDLANVSNAWIDSGVIRDASISDAKIIGVSANKLTAGTINASNINVANLRASNLIVDKVNGQPVLGGYTIVSKSSTGYDNMNPRQEGWYEFSNGNFFQSTDTAVDASKTYYTSGAQVALYDQTYIDGMESTLNDRIDGTIQTYTGGEVPTLVNYPYTDWYDTSTTPTTDNRAEHVGDIYYVINASSSYDGYCYRFAYDNSTSSYSWVLIKDSDVTAALSDITELQTFQSTTESWIDETDEGLITIRTNQTTLEGLVNKTIVSAVQLWYTKSNTTAPTAPTSHVTTDNPSTANTWNISQPSYNSSYPNYFYCYEWQYVDGTYGWSPVTRDIGIGETTTGTKLWFANANNTTPPSKPTSKVTSSSTSGNAWRIVVPSYSATYPYYYYCYQYESSNGTFSWSDVVYDGATTKNQENAPALSQVSTKVSTSTFNELSNTVSENSASITTLSSTVDAKADSSTVQTLSNTVNTVSQTASSNSSIISNLTTRLGTNADGTQNANDIVSKEAALEQDLEGFKTTVSETYVTADDFSEVETVVEQTANNVLIKATESDSTAAQAGAHVISSIINVATSGVTIDASKVNIAGVITAINNDTTTTIDGDKITTGSVSASAIDATSGTFDSANIPNLSANKITTGTLDGSLATITNINASNINSGTIDTARLNVAGIITSINNDTTTTIDGDKITTGSITADQLGANSVTASELAANSVTANAIATNTITADHIAGNTITIGKINTSDPDTASAILNSEIEVGANNLLTNTAEMDTWYTGLLASVEDGVATLTGSSTTYNARIDTDRYDAEMYNGVSKFILSFDYKSTDDCDMVICISATDSDTVDDEYTRTKYTYWKMDPDEVGITFELEDSDGEWQRCVMPWRTIATTDLDNGSGDIVSGYLQFYARSDNTTIQIRHIQLEQGTIATDWSPASIDFIASIDANGQGLSVLDQYIRGGIIDVSVTSSFTGDSVSVDNEDFLAAVSNELNTYHFVYDGSTWTLGAGYETLTGNVVNFNGGGTNIKSFTIPIEPRQAGSGDPSPSNIRLISGYTEANVKVAGKNLFDGTSVFYGYPDSTNSIVQYSYDAVSIITPCSPETTYTISKTSGSRFAVAYTKDYPYIGTPIYGYTANNSASSISITTGSDARYIVSYVYLIGTDSISIESMFSSIQVEQGSSATTYEAFNTSTYQLSFGKAGTVYSGELNVLTGVLSVDKVMIQLRGEWPWVKSTTYSGGYYIFYSDIDPMFNISSKTGAPFMCSHAKSVSTIGEYLSGTCFSDTAMNLRIMSTSSTLDDWKAYVEEQYNNNTPITVIIPLSEPKEYRLLRRNQTIPTKVGINNIWCDVQAATTEILDGNVILFNGDGNDIGSIMIPIESTQTGSGSPSPSNVRPIQGVDGINLYRNAKNIINSDELIASCLVKNGENSYTFSKNENSTDGRISNHANIKLESGKQYTFSFKTTAQSTSGNDVEVGLMVNGTWQTGMHMTYVANGYYVNTFEAPSGAEKLRIYYQNNATGIGDTMTISDIQLEPGYYRTSYEPQYYGTYAANIQIDDESIYGGTFDAISGKLTVTYKKLVFDGTQELTDRISQQNRVYYQLTDMPSGSYYSDAKVMCDRLEKAATVSNDQATTPAIVIGYSNNYVYIQGVKNITGANITDINSMNQWLSANNVTITYPLATPQVYQLSGRTIKELSGANTIWSDINDITIKTETFDRSQGNIDDISLDAIVFSPTVLSNYSITLSETPTKGDVIEVGVGERKSMDDRFADSESSISDYNNQYENMFDDLYGAIDGLEKDNNDVKEEFLGVVETLADEMNRTTSVLNRINTKTAGLDFTTENGLVLYGSNDFNNAMYKLQLAAMAINFIYGDLGSENSIIASIVADDVTQRVLMNISNIVVGQRLMINEFAFIPRTGGHMCLKYLGSEES